MKYLGGTSSFSFLLVFTCEEACYSFIISEPGSHLGLSVCLPGSVSVSAYSVFYHASVGLALGGGKVALGLLYDRAADLADVGGDRFGRVFHAFFGVSDDIGSSYC